jgi:predicted ATPase/signal transduction histidine kinase/GAF domain-containing protein
VPGLVRNLSSYAFSSLRADDLALYRGTGKGLAPILLVTAENVSPACLNRLEHEYTIRADLDAAWAAHPIELSRHRNRLALVLEDPGGVVLDRLLGPPLGIEEFLRIAISLAGALRQMHARGLIHKDIKPGNILVDVANGGVWLTGFGIASRMPRERPDPEPPNEIAGTLAYMAPEQSGRMNRSIDARSDLYSLGVTFYEMMTGALPFAAADPLEWVHCHIARQPVPPDRRTVETPGALSDITMKLLAKTAEERYQTAAGVEADLRQCLAEWESQSRIDPLPLGAHDVSDRLLIPEKLYGRESEIDALLAAFDRVVAGGKPELVLVSGYSGVGKSSVVHELHKVLVPPRGLFASGKFDQYKRDIPYATLAQAFQSLVQRLLGKSEADLASWRDALRDALGPNGRLIIELVPELELIIGRQPPAPDLPPHDARRRFQLTFRRFVGVFARPEHPLALFLDDLQWLDAATLDVLENLLTGPGAAPSDLQHLLLIGAYRANEVTSTHPLRQKLEAIETAGGQVVEIPLAPLTSEHLRQLISQALRCEAERAAPLAHLVHEKTGGNPFFANRFIASLADEGMLTFDHDAARWSWDLGRLQAKGYTDNLVDLMVGKLTRLTAETQKALQYLACVGNAAPVATLSLVYGSTETETHSLLQEAVRADLLERRKDSYHFIHDRIQEAAYLLVPESLRVEAHLRIGRLLAANTPPEQRAEAIYEIVNQLNRGAPLITSAEEREQLAELNLTAGKRAKAATAYGSALNYLVVGETLLPEDCWESSYPLVFAMEITRAECEFLTGHLAAAEEQLSTLSFRAANRVDKAAVACLRAALYTTLARADHAVEVCVEYLRDAGFACSAHPSDEDVREEYERLWTQLGSRPIEALFDLPLMDDPGWRAKMEVLTELSAPAYFFDVNLWCLVLLRMANLSAEHGNCDGSCYAYGYMTAVVGGRFGDYRAGLRFGKLGLDLVEKKGLERFKARVYHAGGCVVIPWERNIRAGVPLLRRCLESALETGDQTYAAYAHCDLVSNRLTSADPLAEVQREAESTLEFVQRARFGLAIDIATAQLGFIRTLRGLTREFGSFSEDGFDEDRFEQHVEESPSLVACWYWVRKLQACFYAGDCAQAVAAAAKARSLLDAASGVIEEADYHFYAALAKAAASDSATPDERREHFGALAEHHKRLALWAETCSENFADRAALVGAEIARLESRELEAERLYEQSIRSAREYGFVQNEGLAHEVAAQFYAARGYETIAHAYLLNARHCYLRWGALGKVRQLELKYPYLVPQSAPLGFDRTIGTPVQHLDLATVIRVSQAVSGEIDFNNLIGILMQTALEHAGGERGLLVLPRGEEMWIEAEATTAQGRVEVRRPNMRVAPSALPESVLHYVIRTKDSVLLDDASKKDPFSADSYVRSNNSRSILCLPLIKQAKLIGVLYLENSLASHVFTPARIAVLRLLASQAATSLENARLYSELRNADAYLAEAQRLSHTGSFGWRPPSGEIYWSEETFRIFEYERSSTPTVERMMGDRVHPEDVTSFRRVVERAAQDGQDFAHEYRLRMPNGRVKYLYVVAHAMRYDTADINFVGAVMDVTAIRLAELELHKTRTELAHVMRVTSLGELTASIAHEVNQPLGAAATNAEACLCWLDREIPNLDAVHSSVEMIIRDVNRAADTIRRVRALAMKTDTQMAPLNLNEVVSEALTFVQHELLSCGVTLRTELATALPLILADKVQLQQVILNLVINGTEAMQAVTDRSRELVIRSEQDDAQQVRLTVTDRGVGFSEENAERLFDAFFTTKSSGMGMGLSICRSIIEAHGGRIWAASNGAQGAAIRFTLPVHQMVVL